MRALTYLCRRGRDDRGSVTVFWLVLLPAMVATIGLTFDAARILAARREAFDQAQNAAVAGTQGLDETATRQGNTSLDPTLVATEVNDYLGLVGATGTHTSTAQTVTVTVTDTVDMEFLSMIGVGSKTVSGTATARAVRGVEGPDT
jgi:Flp pilus assembly protein TadG